MEKENIDILLLQETHFNTNSKHVRGDYTFHFSTIVTDKQRKDKQDALEEYKEKLKKKNTDTQEETN